MRFLVTLLALLSLVGPAEALDLRVGGVTMTVAGTCITLTPSTGLGAVTISTCQDLSTTGTPTFTGLRAADGTQNAPAYSFTGATNMGLFRTSPGSGLGFGLGNATIAFMDAAQFSVINGVGFGFAASVTSNNNITLSRVSNGVLQLGTTANNALGTLNLTGLSALGSVTCCVSTPTAVTNMRVYTPSLTPANTAAAIGASTQTFTVTGLTTDDKVFVNGPASTALCPLTGHARVSGADTLELEWVDLTVALCTPAAGTYTIFAIRS